MPAVKKLRRVSPTLSVATLPASLKPNRSTEAPPWTPHHWSSPNAVSASFFSSP